MTTEEHPLDPTPAPSMRETHAAIRYLEEEVRTAGGIVLRYGAFYGPGTGLAPGAEQLELIERRRFPIVGDGAGVWSFVHVADAADATVAAIEADRPGLYNVVDDDPARVADWLPEVARTVGARPPRHVPRAGGPPARRGGRGGHDDRGARGVEREGQGGARLAAPAHRRWRGHLGTDGTAAPTERRAAAVS